MKVKEFACEKLLAMRVEAKLQGKKVNESLNRLHLAIPIPRDDKQRPPMIPQSVLLARETSKTDLETSKQEEEEKEEEEDPESDKPQWLRGFNSLEWKKKYKLESDEWKFDVIPEIMDGKNIADFIDPEILARLEDLEKEEESREANLEDEMEDDDDDIELDEDQWATVRAIRERRKLTVSKYRSEKGTTNHPYMPKKVEAERKNLSEFESHLLELGINPTQAVERIRSRSSSRVGRKRTRSEPAVYGDGDETIKKRKERSRTPSRGDGFKDFKQKLLAERLSKKAQRVRNKDAKKGEGDRVILNLRPKHLFTGHRGAGKTDRR